MRIVHLYANNLKVWDAFLKDSDCYVNAYTDLDDLEKSLIQFNARDVLGFVLYPDYIDDDLLDFIVRLDSYYIFREIPVVIITEDPKDISSLSSYAFKSISLYFVQSEDGTISDLDIKNTILLLFACNDEVYSLSDIRPVQKNIKDVKEMPEDAKFVLDVVSRGDFSEFKQYAKGEEEA